MSCQAEQLAGGNPSRARDQDALGRDDDGMQKADLGNAFGKRINVAEIAAMPNADDDDVGDAPD